MSFILDALRKAEEERKRITHNVPFAIQRAGKRGIPVTLSLVFVLAALVASLVFLSLRKIEAPQTKIQTEIQAQRPTPSAEAKPQEPIVPRKEDVKSEETEKPAVPSPPRQPKVAKKATSITRVVKVDVPRPIPRLEEKERREETKAPPPDTKTEGKVEVKKVDMERLIRLFNEAVALSERGEKEEAKRIYQEIVREKPDHAEALNNLGLILLSEGNKTDALLCFGRIIDLKKDYPKAYNNIALILLSSGETALAEDYLRKAIEHGGGLEPVVNLSNLLRSQRRYEEAERLLEAYVKKGVNDPSLLISYAVIKDEKGEIKEAIRYYRAFLRGSPDRPERGRVVERLRYLEGLSEGR
jgi:Tfp pilus assembly protein PilF